MKLLNLLRSKVNKIIHRKLILLWMLVGGVTFWQPRDLLAQNLHQLIDRCNWSPGSIQKTITRAKDFQVEIGAGESGTTHEYDLEGNLIKTTIETYASKEYINYYYINNLLVKQTHQSVSRRNPTESFALFFQYYNNRISRILQTTQEGDLIHTSKLFYDRNKRPALLKQFDLKGKHLYSQSVYYAGQSTVVISSLTAKDQLLFASKHYLCHRYAPIDELDKSNFEAKHEKIVRYALKDNKLSIVRSIDTGRKRKEKIQIEEVSFDERGNWKEIVLYELKKTKTKKKKLQQIQRDIIYY